MLGLQRGTQYGYSLWEIGIYGGSSGGAIAPQYPAGGFTLNWTAPTARADGAPLSLADIDGYHIYLGNSPGNYSEMIDVADGTAQSASVIDLPVGTYYLVMTTYDNTGLESAYSGEIAKMAQ
jgi:hypothetical protein